MSDTEDDELAGMTVGDLFRSLATDEAGTAARKAYCDEIACLLEDVAAWLTLDSLFRTGDSTIAVGPQPKVGPERADAFAASSIVAQMSAKLVKGSISLLHVENEYSSSALVRQLIECEYLLRAFRHDFTLATRWMHASAAARHDFSPSKLRKIGGFDQAEYSHHCEAGGHPRVAGRPLLDLERHLADMLRTEKQAPAVMGILWLDLALHCERVWRAIVDLLSHEHARFAGGTPRTDSAQARADVARTKWFSSDYLAKHAGPLWGFYSTDPDTLLVDLFAPDERP